MRLSVCAYETDALERERQNEMVRVLLDFFASGEEAECAGKKDLDLRLLQYDGR